MFGLEYLTAFIKVAFNVAFAIVTAVPFYYGWNRIASVYLPFIPDLYQTLPYWDIVGFFLVCTYLGEQISKLTPKIISVSQHNN